VELKSKLIALIERAFKEEQILIDKLSESERSARGEPDHWSPKDMIVHLAGWKERLAENLAAAATGGTLERYADFEAVNAAEFEQYRDMPWPEVMKKAAVACRQLIQQVEVRSGNELSSTDTLPWQNGRPLWQLIISNGFVHTLAMHLGPLYIQRGEKEYVTNLQEEAARQLAALAEDKNWQGIVRYNLACHYALVGESPRAIMILGEALQLNPGLAAGAKSDSDFTSIREEPDFVALLSN